MCFIINVLLLIGIFFMKTPTALICHECNEDIPTMAKPFRDSLIKQLKNWGIGSQSVGNLLQSDIAFGPEDLNHFCKNLEDAGQPKTCKDGSLCFELGVKVGNFFFEISTNSRLFFKWHCLRPTYIS